MDRNDTHDTHGNHTDEPSPKQGPVPAQLRDADAAAVDRFLTQHLAGHDNEAGAPAASVQTSDEGTDASREAAVAGLFALLSRDRVDDAPAGLAQRTLDRIAATERADRLAFEAPPAKAPPFRLSELATVAAIILVSISVVWPVLERSRTDAREVACRSNLTRSAIAFASYAKDNNGVLPRHQKIRPESPWYKVGQSTDKSASTDEPDVVKSNSAHLFLLAEGGYVHVHDLNCPENHHAPKHLSTDAGDWPEAKAVSYSYQNQYGDKPIVIADNPGLVLLADKNPQFAISHESLNYLGLPNETNSAMHQGRGQNILRADGAVLWSDSPILPNGDVIYKAEGVDSYNGTETPSSASDSFIVP